MSHLPHGPARARSWRATPLRRSRGWRRPFAWCRAGHEPIAPGPGCWPPATSPGEAAWTEMPADFRALFSASVTVDVDPAGWPSAVTPSGPKPTGWLATVAPATDVVALVTAAAAPWT